MPKKFGIFEISEISDMREPNWAKGAEGCYRGLKRLNGHHLSQGVGVPLYALWRQYGVNRWASETIWGHRRPFVAKGINRKP